MKKWYVYVLYRPNGEPFYVGKGTGPRIKRTRRFNKNTHKAYVIAKIERNGEAIRSEIVARFTDENAAYTYEIMLIAKFGRHPNGPLTNMTDGGDGGRGRRLSEATRYKMSHAAKGRRNSESAKRKMSIAHSGKKLTLEHTAKIAAANKGKKRTVESRAKMSAWQVGRVLTEEHKAKIATTLLGRKMTLAERLSYRLNRRRNKIAREAICEI